MFKIDPDIKKAETLPARFYKSDTVFERVKERIFLNTWHFIGDKDLVALPPVSYTHLTLPTTSRV